MKLKNDEPLFVSLEEMILDERRKNESHAMAEAARCERELLKAGIQLHPRMLEYLSFRFLALLNQRTERDAVAIEARMNQSHGIQTSQRLH